MFSKWPPITSQESKLQQCRRFQDLQVKVFLVVVAVHSDSKIVHFNNNLNASCSGKKKTRMFEKVLSFIKVIEINPWLC